MPVARPKNRGGNTVFKGTAPVFMTAPAEVTLTRRGQEVEHETDQMRSRIKYFTLTWQIPVAQQKEVLKACAACTAKLYLEGAREQADSRPAASQEQPAQAEPAPKRPRTALEVVRELGTLGDLHAQGMLSLDEFTDLMERLLSGD